MCILDHHAGKTIENRPFKHIAEITRKCNQHSGNLRKIIRLLKNLRYDADPQLKISSYDIAAIAWHMNSSQLLVTPYMDLMLLHHTQNHLWFLLNNENYRNSIMTPDGTRKVFDSTSKVMDVRALAKELNQLIEDIAKAVLPAYYSGNRSDALNRTVLL